MARIHANNYSDSLNGAITNVQTTITVNDDTGLPTITGSDTYNLTISYGEHSEIVTVTDDSSSPTLTVTRGAEGTSARAFYDGSIVELNVTADSLDRKPDKAADETISGDYTFTGTLDFSGATIDSSEIIGDVPSVHAYLGSVQAITTSTFTKIQLDTEVFDTNADFDSTTNYRFTPTVAGKYLITIAAAWVPNAGTYTIRTIIYKNGAQASIVENALAWATGAFTGTITALFDMNGTTDYLELYVWQNSGGNLNVNPNSDKTYLSAIRVPE